MERNRQAIYSVALFLLVSMTTMTAVESQTPNCTNTTQIDLCFLIDRSGSICDTDPKFNFTNPADTTCDNWAFIVSFVYRFVTDLYIGTNDVRVAVVIFDDIAYLKWNLTGFLDKTALLNAINTTLEYNKGRRTNTSDGLKMIADQVFIVLDRPAALKTAIIITDGKPTNVTAAYEAVDRVHAMNITTFVVGVTNQIDESTLQRLSSQPQEEGKTYFIAQTFSTIDTVRQQVLAQTCLQPSTSTTSTTTTTTTSTTTSTTSSTTPPTTPHTPITPSTTLTTTSIIPTVASTTSNTISANASITTRTATTIVSTANTGTPPVSTKPSTPGPTIPAPLNSTTFTEVSPTKTTFSNQNVSTITQNSIMSNNSVSPIYPPTFTNNSVTQMYPPTFTNYSASPINPPTFTGNSSSQSMNSLFPESNTMNNGFTGSGSTSLDWDPVNGTRSASLEPPGSHTADTTPDPYQCSPNCAAGCNLTGVYKCDRCDPGYELTANGTCYSGISFASVGPLRGPVAGGTKVMINGTWPSETLSVTAVFIGNGLRGTIVEVSRLWGVDSATFITPPAEYLGNLLLVMQFSGYYPDPKVYSTFNVSTDRYFSYSDNPRIWEVFPRQHLVSGGTMLTAVGSNLTSVGYAAIQTMVEVCRFNAYGQSLACTKSSRTRPCDASIAANQDYPTMLVCKMPQIDLPADFLDILDNMTVPSNLTLNFTRRDKRDLDSSRILSRHRRSAPVGSVQSMTGSNGKDTADIYLRFILDGFQGNDLHQVLQDTRFYFFTAPEITSSHEVVSFNLDEETTISIEGRHMLRGCAINDYMIRLGKGNCSISQLTDSQLTCSPPDPAPENTNEFDYKFCDLRFTIIVSIGDKIYFYRCLEYTDPNSPPPGCPSDCWNNSSCSWKWTRIVLIVGLVIGLFLLLIVIILAICLIVVCSRNRRHRRLEPIQTHLGSMGAAVHGSLGGNHAALNGGKSRGSWAEDYLTAAAEEDEVDVDRVSGGSSVND